MSKDQSALCLAASSRMFKGISTSCPSLTLIPVGVNRQGCGQGSYTSSRNRGWFVLFTYCRVPHGLPKPVPLKAGAQVTAARGRHCRVTGFDTYLRRLLARGKTQSPLLCLPASVCFVFVWFCPLEVSLR